MPILIVDVLFVENFVSQAVMSTNRAYQMTVLLSALTFIEENLPQYYEARDKTNPLKEQHFTPNFHHSGQGSHPPITLVIANGSLHGGSSRNDEGKSFAEKVPSEQGENNNDPEQH